MSRKIRHLLVEINKSTTKIAEGLSTTKFSIVKISSFIFLQQTVSVVTIGWLSNSEKLIVASQPVHGITTTKMYIGQF